MKNVLLAGLLAGKYGVQGIPMYYLRETRGIIVGKEWRGEEPPAKAGNALMQ